MEFGNHQIIVKTLNKSNDAALECEQKVQIPKQPYANCKIV